MLDASEPNDQVGGAPSRGSLPTGPDRAAGSRGIESIHVVDRSASRSSTRCPPNLNSHNHNQHAGRPCFSLAIQIERSTSTLRYDISRLRNSASHVSSHAIHVYADCSPLHRSMTAEPSRERCKQSARQAMPMTIGRHCKRRPPHDLRIRGCRFYFGSSFNCGSTTDVAELRIRAMSGVAGSRISDSAAAAGLRMPYRPAWWVSGSMPACGGYLA
jgi:hypothetical protein